MKSSRYLFLVLIIIAILTSCNDKTEEKQQEKNKKEEKNEIIKLTRTTIKEINLVVAEVTEGQLKGEITAPAKLIPNQDLEAYVGTLILGRVSKVFVKIGDNVSKGQSLMLIEGLQIGEIKAQFLKTKANLIYCEENYNRLKTLFEQNVGSQKSLLEAKAEYEKAKAEFNAEDNKIHSIGLADKDIENNCNNEHVSGLLEVKSPISGTVVERNVVIGQLVEPNTNSFRIINTSSLFAEGQIYENEVERIAGMPEIFLTTTAYPQIQFKGKIIYVSDIVDKESRTIKIRAAVSNQDKKLKPEMFAEMHIPTGKQVNALIVPSEAVIKDGDDNYVFVAINDTTFEKRNVVPGSRLGEFIEIKSELKKGDKIVINGTFMLKSELKKDELTED